MSDQKQKNTADPRPQSKVEAMKVNTGNEKLTGIIGWKALTFHLYKGLNWIYCEYPVQWRIRQKKKLMGKVTTY